TLGYALDRVTAGPPGSRFHRNHRCPGLMLEAMAAHQECGCAVSNSSCLSYISERVSASKSRIRVGDGNRLSEQLEGTSPFTASLTDHGEQIDTFDLVWKLAHELMG